MSCDYQYTTQPAQRALSCSRLTAFVLQCQVVSNWIDFSITWHYSNYEPDSSNLHTATDIHDSKSTSITTMWDYSYNTTNASLTSDLRISEINEKNNINIDGYYVAITILKLAITFQLKYFSIMLVNLFVIKHLPLSYT